MSDIVERLRHEAVIGADDYAPRTGLLNDAADEIEWLRAIVREFDHEFFDADARRVPEGSDDEQ